MWKSLEKNLKEIRLFSLKKQISRIIFIGVLLITLLLGIALVVSVNSYQKKQHKNRIDDLESYAEVLDSSIVQLNGVIDAIYSNDSSFEGIDQYRTILEELDYTYVFRNLLKMQVQANRNLKGLFLYYDNFDKVLYSVNEKISYGEKEALKQGGMNFGLAIGNQIYTQESYVIKNEEHVFFNILKKKTSAAICGCISLKQGLPDVLEYTATYGIIFDNVFYNTAGENFKLDSKQIHSLVNGQNHISGAEVYMKKLGTTDLAVIEIVPANLWIYVSWIHIILAVISIALCFLSIKVYYDVRVKTINNFAPISIAS